MRYQIAEFEVTKSGRPKCFKGSSVWHGGSAACHSKDFNLKGGGLHLGSSPHVTISCMRSLIAHSV